MNSKACSYLVYLIEGEDELSNVEPVECDEIHNPPSAYNNVGSTESRPR